MFIARGRIFPPAGLKRSAACPDIFNNPPIPSVRRPGSNGSPGTRIEDSPLSDRRSLKVDDAQAVLWSAEILEISEFELFGTAYQAWYRETAPVARLERIFADYMCDEVVPSGCATSPVRPWKRTTAGAGMRRSRSTCT